MALLSSSIGRFRVLKGWLPSRRPAGYPSRISRESFVVASIFLVLGIRGGLGMRSGGMRQTMKKKGLGFAMLIASAPYPSEVFCQSVPAASSNSGAGDTATPATTTGVFFHLTEPILT